MYRKTPSTCIACSTFVSPEEADLTADGLRCWRCSARDHVERLHEQVRTRVPAWQHLLLRATISIFTVGSLRMILGLYSNRTTPYALADLGLVAVVVHSLMRRPSRVGGALVAAQAALLLFFGVIESMPSLLLTAMVLVAGLGLAGRAAPLYPSEPRLGLDAPLD